MNFDLTDTNWTEVTNLTNGNTYVLQAKNTSSSPYTLTEILVFMGTSAPSDVKVGQLATDVKFKKIMGVSIYVKAFTAGVNIEVQEV